MKMLVIKTDGTVTLAEKNGLESLQEAVGGWIEGIDIGGGAMMYCNEEGKLNSLPPNWIATKLYEKVHGLNDVIMGNVTIVGCISPDGEYDGEDYDPPQAVIDEARRLAAMFAPRCVVS